MILRAHTPSDRTPRRIETGCTIRVEHSFDSLEAHVELDDDLQPSLGDRIRVHGEAITVPFGESLTLRRPATLVRANAFEKAMVRLRSMFEMTELYEVSFTPGRLK